MLVEWFSCWRFLGLMICLWFRCCGFSIACATVNSVEQLHWLRLCDYLCYFGMVCELSVVDYYCLVGVFRLDELWFWDLLLLFGFWLVVF